VSIPYNLSCSSCILVLGANYEITLFYAISLHSDLGHAILSDYSQNQVTLFYAVPLHNDLGHAFLVDSVTSKLGHAMSCNSARLSHAVFSDSVYIRN